MHLRPHARIRTSEGGLPELRAQMASEEDELRADAVKIGNVSRRFCSYENWEKVFFLGESGWEGESNLDSAEIQRRFSGVGVAQEMCSSLLFFT